MAEEKIEPHLADRVAGNAVLELTSIAAVAEFASVDW